MFIDGVEQHIRKAVPGAGVRVVVTSCAHCCLSDGFVLMASTAEQLKQQSHALQQFCDEQDMQVNVQKTKVLVTGEGQEGRFSESWFYAGQQMQQVAVFKYFGIEVHAVGGLKGSHTAVTAAANKAMWAMLRQVKDVEILSVLTRVWLFNSLVMPVLQYGCEIWSTEFIRQPGSPLDNPAQRVQSTFLRQIIGDRLPKSISLKMLMAELSLLYLGCLLSDGK